MFLNKDFILEERYKITGKTECSGSTCIYFATDLLENKQIKIKEFFPQAIMKRNEDGSLSSKEGCEVQYKSLKSDFFELFTYIKSISDIGGILPPKDVFYANGTCYYSEELSGCETLEDYLARNEGDISWQRLKKAVGPVVSALRKMHSDGYYHRGISPQNILINDGLMMLTGFDLPPARTNGSEIDSTLYFGFSAPEQYSSASWQGSWTDVYSVAAVCYRALTGITPVEWRQRGDNRETLIPPSSINSSVPENVSNTLLVALSVDIRNRYRTIEDFWVGLLHGAGDTTIVVSTPKFQGHIKKETSVAEPLHENTGNQTKLLLYTVCALFAITVTILLGVIITLIIKQKEPVPLPQSQAQSEASEVSEEVSSHPADILIPSFIGKKVEDVMLNKGYNMLFTFEVERQYSEIYTVGNVVDQSPKPGEQYDEENNTIVLLMSMGSERTTMPLVEGTPLDQASTLLNGLDIKFKTEEKEDGSVAPGTVIKANVPFGDPIMRTKEIVTLTVATEPEESEDE